MRYKEFERIVSQKRMKRYVEACGGNTRKAMTLYRYNVELAKTMFGIIGFFEIALRNAINDKLTAYFGDEWLRDAVMPGGIFTLPILHKSQDDRAYIFNEIDKINTLRNRIAHHEPICFPAKETCIYTEYILKEYRKMLLLLEWMGIDYKKYLFGLDHVEKVCLKIENLKSSIKQYPPV